MQLAAVLQREMGFEKDYYIHFNLKAEKVLIASGWKLEEENVGGVWNSSGTRIRTKRDKEYAFWSH